MDRCGMKDRWRDRLRVVWIDGDRNGQRNRWRDGGWDGWTVVGM